MGPAYCIHRGKLNVLSDCVCMCGSYDLIFCMTTVPQLRFLQGPFLYYNCWYIYIYIYLTTYLKKWSTNYIVAKYIVKKQLPRLDAYFTWNETKNSLEEIVEAKYILPELRFLHDPFDLYLKWKKKRKNHFIITNSWKRDSKSINYYML